MPLSESQIIKIITSDKPIAPNLYGVGDDAALLPNGSVVCQDTMVENVHFDAQLSPFDIGWKLIAVNASDIGAMGHLPQWATLSISIPQSTTPQWLKGFSEGINKALQQWNIQLIGGDTTRASSIMLSLAMGSHSQKSIVWRSSAMIGDDIWVTGQLGQAALAFFHPNELDAVQIFHRPQPPVHFGHLLCTNALIHAMTDISDGLEKDITAICYASGVGAILDPNQLPSSDALKKYPNQLAYQTSFGEDYQLLFTASPQYRQQIQILAQQEEIQATHIGSIRPATEAIQLKDRNWPPSLFSHFSTE